MGVAGGLYGARTPTATRPFLHRFSGGQEANAARRVGLGHPGQPSLSKVSVCVSKGSLTPKVQGRFGGMFLMGGHPQCWRQLCRGVKMRRERPPGTGDAAPGQRAMWTDRHSSPGHRLATCRLRGLLTRRQGDRRTSPALLGGVSCLGPGGREESVRKASWSKAEG